jgi:hypothetical protein
MANSPRTDVKFPRQHVAGTVVFGSIDDSSSTRFDISREWRRIGDGWILGSRRHTDCLTRSRRGTVWHLCRATCLHRRKLVDLEGGRIACGKIMAKKSLAPELQETLTAVLGYVRAAAQCEEPGYARDLLSTDW